jgi:hypothetical protein
MNFFSLFKVFFKRHRKKIDPNFVLFKDQTATRSSINKTPITIKLFRNKCITWSIYPDNTALPLRHYPANLFLLILSAKVLGWFILPINYTDTRGFSPF